MSINPRPIVLSIAGFDPSGGAGLLADIKTIESHKVYGLGVLTCSTLQNELVFKEINWLETAYIKNQIKLLHQVSKIEVVKIGLVKSLKSLKKITQYLLELNPFVKIIWDPILSSSSGFVFHKKECCFPVGKISVNRKNTGEFLGKVKEQKDWYVNIS